MAKLCGIYKILNLITYDFYIGSAVNFRNRWYKHRYELVKNMRHSQYLQNAWNKYGELAFKFSIVLYCDIENLLYYEQVLIDGLKPSYNMCPIAGSCLGVKRSEETRRKLSEIHTGKLHSEETKRKMSEANKGKQTTDETKNKLSEAHKGKSHSEETKYKISESHKGQHQTEETKHKMRESWKTRPSMSEETKHKLSEAAKYQWEKQKAKSSRIGSI